MSTVPRIFSNELLPDPDLPTIITNSPLCIQRLTPRMAGTPSTYKMKLLLYNPVPINKSYANSVFARQ